MIRMKVVWRFFVGEDQRWRWQQLTIDRTVVAESRSSYTDHAHCMSAARANGYVFEASQDKLVRPGNQLYPRR
jgi:hypothetical protein